MISWIFIIVGFFFFFSGLFGNPKDERYTKEQVSKGRFLLAFVVFPIFMLLAWLTS